MPRWMQFLVFFATGAAFWSCICWYIGTKVARALDKKGKKARPVKLLVWFTAFIYPLGSLLERFFWPGPVAVGLIVVGAYLIGIVSVALSVFLLGDLCVWLFRIARSFKLRPGGGLKGYLKALFAPLPRKAYIGLLAFTVLACGAAAYEGLRTPRIRTIELEATGSPEFRKPIVIAHVSDIHLGRQIGPSAMADIVAGIEEISPDLLVITGDLFDDTSQDAIDAVALLEPLNPSLGKFLINGNHEFYVGATFCRKHAMNAGLELLRQENRKLGPGLAIAGVDDDHFLVGRKEGTPKAAREALHGLKTEDYNILLTHRPVQVPLAASLGADLILAGHTHGGQVPPFQLFSPMGNHGFLHGLYEIGASHLYVTSGAGTWGPRMRLFAPMEIVKFVITPAPAE